MKDQSKTKQVLIQELASLRERITELEQSESERKWLAELLKKTGQELNLIFDMAPLLIWQKDCEGRYLQVNKAYCVTVGLSKDTIIGKTDYDLFFKEIADQYVSHDRKVLDTGMSEFGIEEYHQKSSGEYGWSRTDKLIYYDVDGKINGTIGFATDITDRKQAEDVLRESEENFRRSLDESPLGVRIATPEGETIYANWVILDINDCDSLEELKATPVEKRYTPESFAEHQIRKEERKRGNYDPSEYDISIVRKDGEVRHLQVFRKDILWDGKRRFQVLYQDITSRKRVEEALQNSEDRFKNLYQESPIPTFTWQRKGDDFIFVDYNNAALQMTNGKVVDFLGKSAVELYTDRPQVLNDMNFCFQERSAVRREVVSRQFAPGKFISVHYGFIPPDLIIVHAEDKTDRKHIEDDLRESEKKFSAAFYRGPQMMAISDIETGRYLEVNDNFSRVTGFSKEEIIGKTSIELGILTQEDRQKIMQELQSTGSLSSKEIRMFRKNREPINCLLFGEIIPVFGTNRLLSLVEDITERKRTEERIYASLREKDILLRELHHRVKNNMQVISGLLALQARSSGNPELTGMLNESQRRIRSMALIHEKLYGSKDFARIDLAGYVKVLSRELFQSYKINPGKIDLTVQTGGDVYVDINKAIPCGLILNELISNALKHAFPGGRQGELQIIIRETKNTEIEIVVRDNGLGLPDDVDIREPRTVGLYLVNGLVKNQLDGQIEVRRDNGTEFRIKFPL